MKLTTRQKDIICIVAIITLATVFLASALRPGYTLLPLGLEAGIAPWHKQVTQQAKNLLLSDPFYTFYPRRHFFTEQIRAGRIPLWNPYIFSGHPVFGDTAAQTFYPLNLVAALGLPAARALPILAWVHLTLTGVAMFGFLRLWKLKPAAALFGAIAWMLNSNIVVWLENPHRLSTLAWLPGILVCYELALQKERAWPAATGGILYGIAVLGGHTQFALGSGLVVAAYALFRTITCWKDTAGHVWRPLGTALVIGLLGTGIGALQLIPSQQLAGISHRSVMGVNHFVSSRWPAQHLLSLWIPDFYGNPVRFPYWGQRNFAEVTVYYGAFALPLSLGALIWSRRAGGRFFASAGIAAALMALGTPLIQLVAWIPGIRYFRLISLVAYLPFLGSAAAAFGLEAALDDEHQGWTLYGGLAVILLALSITTGMIARSAGDGLTQRWNEIYPTLWRTSLLWVGGLIALTVARWRRTLGTFLLLTLLALDLLQWGLPFNPVNSLDILYPENEVTAWLRQDPGPYRVLPLQSDRVVFGPNVLSVLGFSEPGGYSSLMVSRYRELVKAIDDQVAIWWMRPNQNMLVNSRFDPLFSMLNVKYVLISHQLQQPLFSTEVARAGCAPQPIPLTPGARITETFRVQNPGLNRVDIEFKRLLEAGGGKLRFLLWQGPEGGRLIADIPVAASDVGTGSHPFFFAPVSDSAGQTFVWALEREREEGTKPALAVCAAQENPERPAFSAYSVQLELAEIPQGVWTYRNPNALPRAYVSYHAEALTDQEALARIRENAFDPWHSVIVPQEQASTLAALTEASPDQRVSPATVVEYTPHRVVIEAQADAPGLLVLSDTWYPGWRATVDDAETDVLRVNYVLRGVRLEPGAHRVVFRFAPTSLYLGGAVAVSALVTSLAVIWIDLRHKAPAPTDATAEELQK